MDSFSLGGDENTVLEKLSSIASELTKISGVIAEMATIKQLLFTITEKIDSFETCHCKGIQMKSRGGPSKDEDNLEEEIKLTVLKEHEFENKQSDTTKELKLTNASTCEENSTNSKSEREETHPLHIDKKRKRRLSSDIEAACLGKALQENIVTLVEDIQFSSSGLGDLLIGNDCLTGDECAALYPLNPKDQIRNTVRLIKGRSFEVIKKFLKCVQRFHPEVSEMIWKSFEEKKRNFVSEKLCIYCKLKRSIDVRYIADYIWSIDGISDDVYADIVSHTRYNVTGDAKWERFADACNKSNNKKILKTIVYALERKGYYSHLIPSLKRETKLVCRCCDLKDVKLDFQTLTETSDDDRSTMSPLSSNDDTEYPSLPDAQDLYSSENSVDMDEEKRYSAIRLHVSHILSDAQVLDCLVLTANPNDDVSYERPRSHSFVKSKRFPAGGQRRASCFNF